MELSITAVTRSRALSKALVRAGAKVSDLKRLFAGVPIPEQPFDILQLVLMDRPLGHTHHNGTKQGDRLYQVEVGFDGIPCARGDEVRFVEGVRQCIVEIIPSLPISATSRTVLTRKIHSWIEQRSGEGVRRLENTEPNENATRRFF
jgi:hypothetical protein